jgi:hypothetical protein
MSEDGISAYVLDESGEKQAIEVGAQADQASDAWDEPEQRPGHHADGSRAWRFRPQADPRSWSDLTYIDNNLDEVKELGWIEDNPEGASWTTEEAVQAYERWAEEATAAYRTVVDDEDQAHADPYVPVAERPFTPPMAVAAVTAEAYARPAAPAAPKTIPELAPPAVSHGDVMDELRRRVPENDGRWTATQAAGFEQDAAFMNEQGIMAAQDRWAAAADGAVGPDGTMTPEAFNRMNDASADVAHATVDADTSRNRYQQTTGYDESAAAGMQHADIDEHARLAREQAAADPQSMGLGMTYEQQQARADVQEYMARSGQELDPAVPLNAEQRAWLEQVRQAE